LTNRKWRAVGARDGAMLNYNSRFESAAAV
jgi:hypothetical protein